MRARADANGLCGWVLTNSLGKQCVARPWFLGEGVNISIALKVTLMAFAMTVSVAVCTSHAESLGRVWHQIGPIAASPQIKSYISTYNDNAWAMVQKNGKYELYNTENMLTWNLVSDGPPLGFFQATDAGLFVYSSTTLSYKISTSNDGIAWTTTVFDHAPPTLSLSAQVVFEGKLWGIGNTGSEQGNSRKIWRLDPEMGWVLVNDNPPWPQERTAMGLATSEGRLYAVSGCNGLDGANLQCYPDVFSTTDGITWRTETDAAPWGGRYLPVIASLNGNLWLYSGTTDGTTILNDVWKSTDGSSWQRTKPNVPDIYTLDRNFFSFKGRLWIVDDPSPFKAGPHEVWSSGDGVAWDLFPTTPPWTFRSRMGCATFNGAIWLLGGADPRGLRNDVWKSTDGLHWDLVNGNAPWAKRENFCIVVHDAALWLMGGKSGTTYYNDVWRSEDGENWTEITKKAQWSPRFAAAAVSFKDKLWLLGGFDGRLGYKEVWTSVDGVAWSLVTDSPDWPPLAALGCTVHRGRIFIVSGRYFSPTGALGDNLYDAWSSEDGKAWDYVGPGDGFHPEWPPIRSGAGLLSYGGKLWLSGGYSYLDERTNNQYYLNDTWSSIDGRTWNHEAGNNARGDTLDGEGEGEGDSDGILPMPYIGRQGHAFLAYADKLWVMGGSQELGYLNSEVWSSSGTVVTHTLDRDRDGRFSLSELLRAIQLYNSGGYHCDPSGEDGFAPGPGDQTCPAHNADYSPQDFQISLSELLRLVQFYNIPLGYQPCDTGEDGFCPVE